jgi:peptidylprolyl isomerase
MTATPFPRAGLPSLALLLLFAGPPTAASAEVVARVAGAEVTRDELRSYLATLAVEERTALERDPALLGQVVRAHLARQAVLRELRQRKWQEVPANRARLDRVRDDAAIDLYLDEVSRPPEGFPDEAELLAAYEASRKALERPRQWRVAQIYLAAPRGLEAEAERKVAQRLEALRARLRKGEAFAEVAAASDERGAGSRGGDAGWLAEEQLVPGVRAAVAGLAKGAVSEPVRLDDGWHLVKVLDEKPAGPPPLAEVREALSAQLRAARARALRQAHLARLLEKSPPVVNELALSRLLKD